jgi:hypothetical protein
MLQELRTQRGHIEEAILALERLAAGRGKCRRGRRPAWLKAAEGMSSPAPTSPAKPAKRRVTSIRAGRKKEENKLPVEQAS